MKNLITLCILLSTSGIAIAQTTHFVDVFNFGFSPSVLNINPNDTVTFTNTDGFHNVEATDNSFRCANGCDGDGMGGNGNPDSAPWTFSITFTTPNSVIDYFCSIHTSMTGRIIVGPELPIELVSFDALVEGKSIELFWETESEQDNAGFEIQQSRGHGNWVPIAFVEGAGSTLDRQSYRYTHLNDENGLHFFRLMQVDFDGSFSFSPIVEAWVDLPEILEITKAYPNPFHSNTHFTVTLRVEQEVKVSVFSGDGRELTILHDGVLSGKSPHRFTFDAKGMATGSYFIRVVSKHFTSSKQVFLVK